jgi:hypothetical protein
MREVSLIVQLVLHATKLHSNEFGPRHETVCHTVDVQVWTDDALRFALCKKLM